MQSFIRGFVAIKSFVLINKLPGFNNAVLPVNTIASILLVSTSVTLRVSIFVLPLSESILPVANPSYKVPLRRMFLVHQKTN